MKREYRRLVFLYQKDKGVVATIKHVITKRFIHIEEFEEFENKENQKNRMKQR